MEPFKAFAEIMEMDTRQNVFTEFDANVVGYFRPRTLADVYKSVQLCELHAGVPEKLRDQFQTARHLVVYSWFYYSFNATAQLTAFTVLEAALKQKSGEPKTSFANLLKKAIDAGWIDDSQFSFPKERLHHIRKRNEGLPPSLRSPEPPFLREYCDMLAKLFPMLRNNLAHGDGFLDEKGAERVAICAEFINQLFDRPAIEQTP